MFGSSYTFTVGSGEGFDGSPGCASIHEGDRLVGRRAAARVRADLPGRAFGQTPVGQQSAQSQVVIPTRPLTRADAELEKDYFVRVKAHAQVPYAHLAFFHAAFPAAVPPPVILVFLFLFLLFFFLLFLACTFGLYVGGVW